MPKCLRASWVPGTLLFLDMRTRGLQRWLVPRQAWHVFLGKTSRGLLLHEYVLGCIIVVIFFFFVFTPKPQSNPSFFFVLFFFPLGRFCFLFLFLQAPRHSRQQRDDFLRLHRRELRPRGEDHGQVPRELPSGFHHTAPRPSAEAGENPPTVADVHTSRLCSIFFFFYIFSCWKLEVCYITEAHSK